MNDIESIFLCSIEKRCLPKSILVFQIKPFLQQKIKTFLFPLPTNIKKHSLLVTILKVRIRSMFYEQLHDVVRYLVVYENRGEVECRLSSLRFESIYDDGVILFEQPFHFFDGTELCNVLPTFDSNDELVDSLVRHLFFTHPYFGQCL